MSLFLFVLCAVLFLAQLIALPINLIRGSRWALWNIGAMVVLIMAALLNLDAVIAILGG